MSLGLVAYDESENESDPEEDLPPKISLSIKKEIPAPSKVIINNFGVRKDNSDSNGSAHVSDEEVESIHSSADSASLHLPESKLTLINTDIDIKCLTSATKKSGPVKITIPSLNEVTDESEPPSRKKLKPSQKGSGLFALLPTPKSSLVPQSVANKKSLATPVKKPTPPASQVKKTAQPKVMTLISYEDSGDEEETSENVDFFSLKEKDPSPVAVDVNIDIPEISATFENKTEANSTLNSVSSADWQSTRTTGWTKTDNHQNASSSHSSSAEDVQPNFGYSTSEFMSVSNSDLELDQTAMQQLCGKRDRLKMQDVSLIDVSGDAIMPDSREWLTKQLTEEVVHRPSHKRKDGPTSQQKRKHQITYLAYQAKENELELKNQWANNRMSRKQTQAKYGF